MWWCEAACPAVKVNGFNNSGKFPMGFKEFDVPC